MRLDTAQITRRSLLAAALASSARWSPPAFASSIDERTREAAQYVASPSGLPYFDTPIFYGNGFEDLPCGGSCLRRKWSPPDEAPPRDTAAAAFKSGDEVRVDYRVRRGFFNGEIVALSDGPGNGGSLSFRVGDGSVNAAVDELVRTLPRGVVRRAVIPPKYDLDVGTRAEYPEPAPPGTTYLELTLRKPTQTGPFGVCPGSSLDYDAVASSVCGKGPTSAKLQEGFFDGFVSPMPAGGVRQQ